VRSDTVLVNRIAWATPAGAQTAHWGGATQDPCSVQTLSTPDDA
jgi:hypothetical protein